MAESGERPFRAGQIFSWLYRRGARTFDEMKDLPLDLRRRLREHFVLSPLAVREKQAAPDGTTKFLFSLEDGEKIETVLIPTASRATVCVSTQAGCKFGCRFCASGIGGWRRDLTAAEILAQILQVKEEARRHPRPLTHIVFMGTGEGFDNYDNLMKAVRVANDKRGLNIGARRITVSTVGLVPGMERFAREGLQVELAVSLHGYNDASRNKLMPVNRRYPFNDLMQACRDYVKKTRRQITFEYILIKDVTCTAKAAEELAGHLKGMICKLNLIPYNPVQEFPHKPPGRREIRLFRKKLETLGLHATVRYPRGREVSAACGQLRHNS